jgi:hypothetical protein
MELRFIEAALVMLTSAKRLVNAQSKSSSVKSVDYFDGLNPALATQGARRRLAPSHQSRRDSRSRTVDLF